MISEVAWAGTDASPHDEWIEIHNTGDQPIDLTGWHLSDSDDIHINLQGTISAFGFYLLERSNDSTVSNITADVIYTGTLKNEGERLQLFDPSGKRIDSANLSGGPWPAGESPSYSSMERLGGDDQPGNWQSFVGTEGNGIDADGRLIYGTPRQPNSIWFSPVSTPSSTPSSPSETPYPPLTILINEIAWAGTMSSSSDEWIELYNTTSQTIDLPGWTLGDGLDINISLSGSISPYSYFLLERSDDGTIADLSADQIFTGSLRNSGERLVLRDPSGQIIDTADGSDGWPAGDRETRASMERWGGEDKPGNWRNFSGMQTTAHDAEGNPIPGTPRGLNSSQMTFDTPTPTSSPGSPASPGDVLINEIAWSGTAHSASDEWIELYNTTDRMLDLSGWSLSDGYDINVSLAGSIDPGGFFLLERTDDACVQDISADLLYTGILRNTGEQLLLLNPHGEVIDSANQSGGNWPSGNTSAHASMERRGGGDHAGNWGTFTGYFGFGHDASGNAIQGTPRNTNSLNFPTPQPTWIPGKVLINEALIRPHYDWQGTGGVDTNDEFIELYNRGPSSVNLRFWILDDVPGAGSKPFKIPGTTIAPGGFVTFFRSRTHIALNDAGDTIRLLDPSGNLVDSISYLRIRASNLSYGRLPDGSDHLTYGLWPTVRAANLLFIEALQYIRNEKRVVCPDGMQKALRIARISRPAFQQIPPWTAPQVFCPQSQVAMRSGTANRQARQLWPISH